MRKFTPLDLSFIAAAGSPERESFRNVASMINANGGWSQPTQVALKEYNKLVKDQKEASKHKQTFVGGLFDLLSSPLYGVANALDEAIAGHQKDSNDSVLQDIITTAGGVGTGLVRGVGAGLRGSTAMLDGIPGVNISDEWQGDPTDKRRFSDVGIRLTSKMSTEEAMDPKNWDKAKANIQKEKNEVPEWLQDMFYTNLDSDTAQEDYLQKMRIIGIAEDIGGDPLNLLLGGSKSAATAGKAAIDGLDEARAAKNLTDEIGSGLNIGHGANLKGANKFGEMPVAAELRTIDEAAPGGISVPIPEAAAKTSILPETMAPVIKGGVKTAANLGRREKVAKAGIELSRADQAKLVKDISKLAEAGKPDWIYKASDLLLRHPSIEFANTERFLDMANKAAKSRGLRHNASQMAPVLATRIAKDVERVRKVVPAERMLNTMRPDEIILNTNKVKLRPQQAKIANDVIKKFSSQILGKAKAPGTGQLLTDAIARGQNARWSGPQQARMWNHITSSLPIQGAKKYDIATKILQHVEDYFLSKGVVPYSSAKIAESVEGLRLSHLAMALGPKALAENPHLITRILNGNKEALASLNDAQRQAIESLKASEAMASAPAAQAGISAGKNAAAEILAKVQSAGRTKGELNGVSDVAAKETIRLGGGPVAAKVARDYINSIVKNRTSVDAVLNANKMNTQVWLRNSAKGAAKNDPAFMKSVANAVYKGADLPSPASLGKLSGPMARVREGFGAMFNAAYGVKDMRPVFLRNQASALSTSARRAKYYNEIAKLFPPKDVDLWHEAFRAAQADAITEGKVKELQQFIAKAIEDLFGGTGLKAGAEIDSTVAGRARLGMQELNAQMKRFGLGEYQFTASKKATDALGNTRDFSKGSDWLKSWEVWDVKRPYEFMHRIQQAVEHSVREKMMFEEIATRFGSTNKFGKVRYTIDHPRLKGFYFNEEIARQGQQFLKILKEINTPNPKAMQHIDHVISKIKASLTIYIPSHHWTNVIGDVMFNWYAGVNKPQRYTQAMKVMQSQRGRYGDIAEFKKINGPDALKQAIARGMVGNEGLTSAGLKAEPLGNSVITTMRNGQKVTADMIYTAAMREGILPTARVLEEITSDVTSVLDKVRPLGGRGQKAAHAVSEFRDHVPRLAQFIDGISKSGGNFAHAVESSAASVRKWHPDGLDLTRFERNVMKRVFPFYSWTRKAIPLAIESAITASPKVMAYPRLMEELSAINGIEPENGSASGSFPGDQMIPDWLRERGIAPVFGGPGSYGFINPSTPTLDIAAMMGHPGQAAIDMINPIAKVPLELMQGSTLGKQVPIENELDYLSRQIPGVSQAGRVTGYYGSSKSVANSDEQKFLNLINLLTAAKATQSGIYQKSAQFDLRDYLTQKAKGHQ